MSGQLEFGITMPMTHYAAQPAELAVWCEQNGFESLWTGEHTHIPCARKTPFPGGGELPEFYKHHYDPVVALTAAAAVTTKLKIGTSVTVIPDHDPLLLGKEIATLDRVSNGRLLFGIGAGWNAEEMENHGVRFEDRWKYTRECIEAMRRLWTQDEAEYHGSLVNFDRVWSWPKPAQAGGPKIIFGGGTRATLKRVVEYCDGWFPLAGLPKQNLAEDLQELRRLCDEHGRDFATMDLTAIIGYGVDVYKRQDCRARCARGGRRG